MKKVKVGDDSKMSFWNDCWLLNKPLCQQFQALHFHSLHKLASVALIAQMGLRESLVHASLRLQTSNWYS